MDFRLVRVKTAGWLHFLFGIVSLALTDLTQLPVVILSDLQIGMEETVLLQFRRTGRERREVVWVGWTDNIVPGVSILLYLKDGDPGKRYNKNTKQYGGARLTKPLQRLYQVPTYLQ